MKEMEVAEHVPILYSNYIVIVAADTHVFYKIEEFINRATVRHRTDVPLMMTDDQKQGFMASTSP